MPEFRQNPISKEWVVIATERAKRPEDFTKGNPAKEELPPHRDDCPFCAGNEEMTPPPLYTIDRDDGWRLRVVPNKFAALQPDLSPKREQVGKFLRAGGFGMAEVVIESPQHNLTIATMDHATVRNILQAYKVRYAELAQDERVNLITIFRNNGKKAGTSLEHPHSQIIATPIVPPYVRDHMNKCRVAYDTYGACVFCHMLKEELSQRIRVVIESEHFVSFCPFASRSPFEVRILPKRHTSSFGGITPEEIEDLADVLRFTLKKIHIGLENPDYNYIIRSWRTETPQVKHYHWYMVIIPKLTIPAGFEIGTGIYINTTLPEKCAEYLRKIDS